MLNPSRLSSLISSTSFPLNRCPPSSGSQSWGYTTRPRGWGIFNRHYGDFCTGADTSPSTSIYAPFCNVPAHSASLFQLVTRCHSVRVLYSLLPFSFQLTLVASEKRV